MATIKKYNGSTWENAVVRKYGTATDTITTLPADLYADGNNATVGLVGNMSQTGTPTPQNPITPSECGERTGNLFDVTGAQSGYITADGTVISGHDNLMYTDYIAIPNGVTYITQSYGGSLTAMNAPALCFYDSAKTYITGEAFGNVYDKTFTVPNDAVYIRTCYRTTMPWVMLNEGSTALPYQPYGYKLDIESANTTTPVYLGEVQTTRKIKKLVLDGTESDWGYVGEDATRYFRLVIGNLNENIANMGICSHYIQTAISSTTTNVGFTIINSGSQNKDYLAIRPDNAASTSLADFKSYLQQQYSNGTPVTVWYVLATETTGIVNEPIRKIGNYADTVSGITIPTTTGADSFDVQTTLKPSEVSLTYTGWHDASVKEKSRNLFDETVATLNYYVNSSTGELVEGTTYFASDYIEVEQGEEYYWNDVKRSNAGAFYDSNKTFISGWNSSQTRYIFTVPNGAKYVRLTGDKADIDTYMLSKGSTALPYEPYWK